MQFPTLDFCHLIAALIGAVLARWLPGLPLKPSPAPQPSPNPSPNPSPEPVTPSPDRPVLDMILRLLRELLASRLPIRETVESAPPTFVESSLAIPLEVKVSMTQKDSGE